MGLDSQSGIFILPEGRREEISALIGPDFDEWKKSCSAIWEREKSGEAKEIDPRKPSWATFATTNPVVVDGEKSRGVRACIAFHKVPCKFRELTKGEKCSHCALSMMDMGLSSVKPSDQISAVETAISDIIDILGYTPAVFEILPDGSFLNEQEVSDETRTGIFKLASENASVLKIAIESRPEYITAQKIKYLLSLLRDDQVLEIYVGLESIDSFVLDKIIRKGFTVEQFEKKIQEIAAGLSDDEKRKLHFSVYHFTKPPYLTEKESIESAVAVGEKVEAYERETGIDFSVKYEPGVVSVGTFQKYLFDQQRYTPPNYFSIAEIIARSYENAFSNRIKFGQRDDIDDFQMVAAVPDIQNPKMFSPFDYMIYNAVQRFNADQDVSAFCADMSIAIKEAPEFKKWELECYGQVGESALSRLFAKFNFEGGYDGKYEERIGFQKKLWKILDSMEFNKDLSAKVFERGKEGVSEVEASLRSLFLHENIKVLQIKNMKFIDIGKGSGRPKLQGVHADFADATEDMVCQVEVIIENEAGLPQNIWLRVPLKAVEVDLATRFDFIYEGTSEKPS